MTPEGRPRRIADSQFIIRLSSFIIRPPSQLWWVGQFPAKQACLIASVVLLVAIHAGAGCCQSQGPDGTKEELVHVVRVIDGDTIEIKGGERVRYIGIDTPELGEYYCSEATEENIKLVQEKEVRLEKDIEDRDKYGRLLRYVYVGDTMINAELVREGYAYSYSYPPNLKYQEFLLQLQEQARNEGLGIWA